MRPGRGAAGPQARLAAAGRGRPGLSLRAGLASPGLHQDPARELVGGESRLDVRILVGGGELEIADSQRDGRGGNGVIMMCF